MVVLLLVNRWGSSVCVCAKVVAEGCGLCGPFVRMLHGALGGEAIAPRARQGHARKRSVKRGCAKHGGVCASALGCWCCLVSVGATLVLHGCNQLVLVLVLRGRGVRCRCGPCGCLVHLGKVLVVKHKRLRHRSRRCGGVRRCCASSGGHGACCRVCGSSFVCWGEEGVHAGEGSGSVCVAVWLQWTTEPAAFVALLVGLLLVIVGVVKGVWQLLWQVVQPPAIIVVHQVGFAAAAAVLGGHVVCIGCGLFPCS